MKKHFYLLFFALSLALFSCKKEKAEDPNAFYIKALKDGKEWRIDNPESGYNPRIDKVTENIIVQASDPSFNETLLFYFKHYKPGDYKIEGDRAAYFRKKLQTSDDDLFVPDTAANNKYTVTTLDGTTNIVTGTFELHLVITNTNTSTEKTSFTKGKFRIQLPKGLTF